jgi:hypothetical protein
MPASFFSLPRELRHKILFDTAQQDEVSAWWNFNYTLNRIREWTTTLREVDDGIVEDVSYVEMQWGNSLRRTLTIVIMNYCDSRGLDCLQWVVNEGAPKVLQRPWQAWMTFHLCEDILRENEKLALWWL